MLVCPAGTVTVTGKVAPEWLSLIVTTVPAEGAGPSKVTLAVRVAWQPLTESPSSFLPGTALLLAVSLVLGWLSYWCIEHPVASMRTRLDKSGRLRPLYNQ